MRGRNVSWWTDERTARQFQTDPMRGRNDLNIRYLYEAHEFQTDPMRGRNKPAMPRGKRLVAFQMDPARGRKTTDELAYVAAERSRWPPRGVESHPVDTLAVPSGEPGARSGEGH
jgi:hypothetical protein